MSSNLNPRCNGHPMAVVEKGARIGADSVIGPFAIIGPEVTLGRECDGQTPLHVTG